MLLLAFSLLTASADVQPLRIETLEPAFVGTIVSTYPDGRISKLWLDRNGTFVAEGRRHDMTGGHWRLKGDSICMKQSKPFPIPFASYCAPVPKGDIAQGWAGKAVTGEPIKIRLTPGREDRPRS